MLSTQHPSYFQVHQMSAQGRGGVLSLPHGRALTPFFMPIATQAAVKTLSAIDLEKLGAEILLSNTYHLFLRPGVERLKEAGGLHGFMGWNKNILTDSGGFQIFSLGRRGGGTVRAPKITEKGVEFQSPIDGAVHFLSPEDVVNLQLEYGVDIQMQLDHFPGYPATREQVQESMERSIRWAERAKAAFTARVDWNAENRPRIFGIVQGGVYEDLRIASAKALGEIGFDGYAIGGLAVGEPEEEMYRVLDAVVPVLPQNAPRYLMGVGYLPQIAEAIRRGVDMFDCVIPTREARHGRLHLYRGLDDAGAPQVEIAHILNERWEKDDSILRVDSVFPELQRHTFSYLRHLMKTQEVLGLRLATMINLESYLRCLGDIRNVIALASKPE